MAMIRSLRWMSAHDVPSKGVARRIIANAIGILAGTGILLTLEMLLAGGGTTIIALVISGVMAFFILGTLSPLISGKQSSSVS